MNGEIRRIPMPGSEHGEVCVNAVLLIGQHVKQNRLGRVMSNDMFIRMSETHCFGADVCFVSYETLPADRPTPKGPLAPPLELVVEVRHSFESIMDVAAKATQLIRVGVKAVLVLDPNSDSAALFRPDELPQRFHNGDTLAIPDVLPGFSAPVAKFFE
ncbi:MAG: Uma2 family endonuclease [Gemmataceae bacterium]